CQHWHPLCARIEGALVDLGAAIERFAQAAHLLRNREVAYSHLPQIVVHVAAKPVKDALRQLTRLLRLPSEPPKQQDQMQNDNVEASLDSVRNPVGEIEGRQARLRHDRAIEGVNG